MRCLSIGQPLHYVQTQQVLERDWDVYIDCGQLLARKLSDRGANNNLRSYLPAVFDFCWKTILFYD